MTATTPTPVGAPRPMPLGKIDRCWVPLDDPGATRFFAEALFVPHGLGRRLASSWRRNPASLVHRLASSTAILQAAARGPAAAEGAAPTATASRLEQQASIVQALIEELGEALPRAAARPASWLLIEDYDQGRRLVCLLFVGEAQPAAVLKIRPLDDPAPLATEHATLERLRRDVPPRLAATMPAPLGYRERGGFAALLLTPLAGRSAYVELATAWRPAAPATAHLAAAVEWLAAFQVATAASAPATSEPVELLRGLAATPSGEDLAWLERLGRLEGVTPPPATAVHGDFWARNLIVPPAGGLPGVVDWEAASFAGPGLHDLFHFALTYALHWPAANARRRPPIAAFQRGFLGDGDPARLLRSAFLDYGRLAGLDLRRLGDWFAIFLLERAARAAAAPPARPSGRLPWLAFLKELTWARRSVFSG